MLCLSPRSVGLTEWDCQSRTVAAMVVLPPLTVVSSNRMFPRCSQGCRMELSVRMGTTSPSALVTCIMNKEEEGYSIAERRHLPLPWGRQPRIHPPKSRLCSHSTCFDRHDRHIRSLVVVVLFIVCVGCRGDSFMALGTQGMVGGTGWTSCFWFPILIAWSSRSTNTRVLDKSHGHRRLNMD